MSSTREDIEADLQNEYPKEVLKWRDGLEETLVEQEAQKHEIDQLKGEAAAAFEIAEQSRAKIKQATARGAGTQSKKDRQIASLRKEVAQLRKQVGADGFEVEQSEEDYITGLSDKAKRGAGTQSAKDKLIAKLEAKLATMTQDRFNKWIANAHQELEQWLIDKKNRGQATQSAKDKRIAKLEAEVEKLMAERDAARKAYLDMIAKAEDGK